MRRALGLLIAAAATLLAATAVAAPISTYPPASIPLTGAEALIGTQNSITKQVSVAQIRDYAASNVLAFGATCGTADSTAGIQAAINYVVANGGGSVVIPCPVTVAGQVLISAQTGGVRLTGNGPMYYPGMPDVGTPSNLWPIASGSAINCTSVTVACIVVNGQGVEIDHINFGNPQPTPAGSFTPTVYPFVISTNAGTNWQGLSLHDLTFTSTSKAINLQGGSYTSPVSNYTGSQIRVGPNIWCNPCLNVGLRMNLIDNPILITGWEFVPSWYFNVASMGAYLRANAVGFDFHYVAAPQIANVDFFALKYGFTVENDTLVNNFGTVTLGISAGVFNNMHFNQMCQSISIPATTNASFTMTNFFIWGDESGFNCAAGKAQVDMPSNQANVSMSHGGAYFIDTFANVGNAGGGASLRLDDIDVAAYSHFTTGQPFIKVTSGSNVGMGTTNMAAIRPGASAGTLFGPGVDATQGYMVCPGAGGGSVPLEGSTLVCGGRDNIHSGFVAFYNKDTTRAGYMGFGTASGIEVASDTGTVFLYPKHSTSLKGLSIGVDGGDHLIMNVNGLPTSCSGQPAGTLWANSGNISYCP